MLENKFYYSISEIAKEFNINHSTLHYWEKIFTSLKPDKNRRGVRLYRQQDVEIIRKILYLTKDKGYTLDGVRKILSNDKIKGNEDEVLQTLLETKQFLLQLKEQLSMSTNE
ncbi:MAG: MerR family transcriptional regulator [Bacteroidales bacterium]